MNQIAKVVSLITLLLVVLPCVVFFYGMMGLESVKIAALVGTIGWFIATPMWMSRELPVDANEVEI